MSKKHPAALTALTRTNFKPKSQEGPGSHPPAQALPGSKRGAPPSNKG